MNLLAKSKSSPMTLALPTSSRSRHTAGTFRCVCLWLRNPGLLTNFGLFQFWGFFLLSPPNAKHSKQPHPPPSSSSSHPLCHALRAPLMMLRATDADSKTRAHRPAPQRRLRVLRVLAMLAQCSPGSRKMCVFRLSRPDEKTRVR